MQIPLLRFEPKSPQPQSKSDDLDRLAMGRAYKLLSWLSNEMLFNFLVKSLPAKLNYLS